MYLIKDIHIESAHMLTILSDFVNTFSLINNEYIIKIKIQKLFTLDVELTDV